MERNPTLCEINYNPLDGLQTITEDRLTPYRYRSLRTYSPEYHDRYRDNILVSQEFYEPVTFGCRTPPYASNVSKRKSYVFVCYLWFNRIFNNIKTHVS